MFKKINRNSKKIKMQIINGKWVDNNDNSINNFNFPEFQQIMRKATCMYGKEITHDRIKIIAKLESLNPSQEFAMSQLLEDDRLLSKLLKY